jgi:hypothetical protein
VNLEDEQIGDGYAHALRWTAHVDDRCRMIENTAHLARDRKGLGTSRMPPRRRTPVDNTTKTILAILPFIALAFMSDHAVSNLMYALGYDRNKVSYFWLLRNQYEYWTEVKHLSGLTPYPFHVFDLIVWAMIPVNLLRIAKGIFFMGYADDVRSPYTENISGGPYVLFLFAFSLFGFVPPLFISDFAKEFQILFVLFPSAAFALEAWYFCVFLCPWPTPLSVSSSSILGAYGATTLRPLTNREELVRPGKFATAGVNGGVQAFGRARVRVR